MKSYLIKGGVVLAAGAVFTLLPDVAAFAQSSSDPFAAIEEEGTKLVDFVTGPLARILAGLLLFGYIVRFMITKKFDISEAMIFGLCAILLASIGTIVNYFFG